MGKLLSEQSRKEPKKFFKSIQYAGVAAVILDAGQLGGFSMAVLGVLFKDKWGYDKQQVSLVYFALMGGILVGNLAIVGPANRWVPQPHRRIGIFGIGTFFWIIVQAVIMLQADVIPNADILILVSHIIMWCSGALAFPTSMLLASDTAERFGRNCQGTVMGVTNCLVNVGQACGPVIGVFIWSELGDVYVFPYLALTNALAVSLTWYIYFRHECPSAKKRNASSISGTNSIVPSPGKDDQNGEPVPVTIHVRRGSVPGYIG